MRDQYDICIPRTNHARRTGSRHVVLIGMKHRGTEITEGLKDHNFLRITFLDERCEKYCWAHDRNDQRSGKVFR